MCHIVLLQNQTNDRHGRGNIIPLDKVDLLLWLLLSWGQMISDHLSTSFYQKCNPLELAEMLQKRLTIGLDKCVQGE